MSRKHRKNRKKVGLPPGAPVYTGEQKTEKISMSVFDYDENNFREFTPKSVEECFPYKNTETVSWINIDGLWDVELIEKLCQHYEIHPLLIEDILDTDHRPKMEDHENYLYITLKMLYWDTENKKTTFEQASIVTGKNFVISFQDKPGDPFDPIRDRIRTAKGKIRKYGPDYLTYSLLDTIVDRYFIILENLGDWIEEIEEKLVDEPERELLSNIHSIKRELIFIRKSVWPLREVLSGLERLESPLLSEPTRAYLRDVYDHTVQIIDTIESYRDMVAGMLDVYLSSVSKKMNEIMKVLTIIATIFIPLTFIAGVYGMNFKFMPELEWKYGYFFIWFIMISAAIGMLFLFKRKKWL